MDDLSATARPNADPLESGIPGSPPGTPGGDSSPSSGTTAQPAPAPTLLDRLPGWTVPAILIGVPLLVWLAALVSPSFYDHFIWQYYWGPIKADAENVRSLTQSGIEAHSGYNVYNTLTWAALLGTCILGIAQMLRHYNTPMDAKLIVAATSWVVIGSVAHVLEDTGLFLTPLQYFFITPPIYLLFGAFGIGAFLVGQWLKTIAEKRDIHAALRMLWLVHVVLVVLWLGFWLKPWDQITVYVNPLWVAGFAVISFAVVRYRTLKIGRIDPAELCLTLSIGTYLLVGAYVVSFIREPWAAQGSNAMEWSFVIAPALAGAVALAIRATPRKAILAIVLVGGSILGGVFAVLAARVVGRALRDNLGIGFFDIFASLGGIRALLVALAVAAYIGYRWWSKTKPQLPTLLAAMGPAYALPINLLLIFGQMVDAFATSLGIDVAGYEEKHVLSAYIIDAFRDFSAGIGFDFGATYPTFIAFATVKLLVSLLVVYAIDVYSRQDVEQHPTMIGLVKFAIIMVGLGPGVRDFTRLSLGV